MSTSAVNTSLGRLIAPDAGWFFTLYPDAGEGGGSFRSAHKPNRRFVAKGSAADPERSAAEAGRQRGKCYYCGKKKSQPAMQVDHRVAVYYGGPNHVSNLILACRPCNAYKAQHVLLRAKDNAPKQLVKAKIQPTSPHRLPSAGNGVRRCNACSAG